MTPMTPELSSFWAGTMRHYAREAMAADSSLTSPLVHQAAIDAVCASALATFPNTSTPVTGRGCGRVGPDRVRRAEEYIHAHASTPITLSDIAAAAGCSPRELRAAFRAQWDVSPMGYLRDVRLEGAHRELDRTEPEATLVADVARRWGFAHTGRFLAARQRRYGRDPVDPTGSVGGVTS
jgi:transcriptional regulator GlxA family with amidase domain